MNLVRTLRPLSAAALVLALAACGTSGGSGSAEGSPSAVSTSAGASAAASASEGGAATSSGTGASGTTTSPSSSAPSGTSAGEGAASPSASASEGTSVGTTVALTHTFTTPDGTISFDYPEDWTVTTLSTSTAEIPAWGVNDESGTRMFTLSIRPDGQIASPVTPQNPATVGTLPHALDAQGHPLAIGVGPFPGQAAGVNMANVYAVTSATGTDPLFGYVSRGDGTMVSFEGTQEGGINDQVDMADETQKFMQSDLFRARLLPVLESFTMKPVAR